MVSNVGDIYALKGYVPLKFNSSNAYSNLSGTNLLRKAAQLVKDIEGLDKAPSFKDYLNKNAIDLNQLYSYSPQEFADFIEEIKAKLKADDKPLTVLNVVEAQRSLSTKDDKDVDIKT